LLTVSSVGKCSAAGRPSTCSNRTCKLGHA
jgi:hypothetical protein